MNLRWRVAQSAEIKWWQSYLNKKPVADYLTWKKSYWFDLLQKIDVSEAAVRSETCKTLDAGCGPAGIFMAFPECAITALDPLLDDYEAKLPHFKRSFYPNTHFLAQPLETLDAAAQFDLVFCLNAINHVADLSVAFDKLVAATQKGGKLIVSIDTHNYAFLKHIFRAFPGDILHPHQFDLQEYTAMLTARSCRIDKTLLIKKEFIFDYYVLVATKE